MTKGVGDPPEWMNDEGTAEWHRLTDIIGDDLEARDRGSFIILCSAYGVAERALKLMHETDVVVKGRTKDHSADETEEGEERPAQVKHPAAQVAREYMEKYMKLAEAFYLTPASRTRGKVNVNSKKSGGSAAPAID